MVRRRPAPALPRRERSDEFIPALMRDTPRLPDRPAVSRGKLAAKLQRGHLADSGLEVGDHTVDVESDSHFFFFFLSSSLFSGASQIGHMYHRSGAKLKSDSHHEHCFGCMRGLIRQAPGNL